MKAAIAVSAAFAALALAPSAVAAVSPASSAHAARSGPAVTLRANSAAIVPTASHARAPRVLLRNLRMCTKRWYLASAYRCYRDERRQPFVSESAFCTITIYAFSAVTVRARMEFAGGTLYAATRRVARRTRLQLAFYVEYPITLPAGAYTCRFVVGNKRASATARSAGPSGPIVSTAVCTTASLRAGDAGCSSDQSGGPFARASSLSCSGWLVAQHGKRAAIEMLYNDNGVWTSVSAGEGVVTRAILPVTLVVPSLLGGPFLPGQYVCRFSVNGQVLAEKGFGVSG